MPERLNATEGGSREGFRLGAFRVDWVQEIRDSIESGCRRDR